ncbi:hypothetical protein RMATCC62417_00755 [Rhizopus microsporus]|nr:hypothetical protein RMATCC62417_00755 [Rhizopus microsporus]
MTKSLSVLSLNCWGLYIVSKQRQFRLRAIAHAIDEGDYDVIALQEVWMLQDYEYIKQTVSPKIKYAEYFYSGALGSGLAIFSRYPILSSNFTRFTLAGRPLRVLEGDYYVGKGCASVCVRVPEIGLVDVYTTHLQAAYGDKDDYEAQRITECWQIANAVRASVAQNRHVILTGDFNSIPSSLCYKIIKLHGLMTDSWMQLHEDTLKDAQARFERHELSASECIQYFGITCDSPLNTWTKRVLKQHPFAKDIGDRLDYIFYSASSHLQCIQSKVVMEGYIPNTQWSFSDHFAVHSLFTINNTNQDHSPFNTDQDHTLPNYTCLMPSTFHDILDVIQFDITRSARSSKRLLILLGFCLIAVLALFIVQVVLSSTYSTTDKTNLIISSIIIYLLIFLLSVVGTIALIVGFVFGKTEQRSLMQYTRDISNCLRHVET